MPTPAHVCLLSCDCFMHSDFMKTKLICKCSYMDASALHESVNDQQFAR